VDNIIHTCCFVKTGETSVAAQEKQPSVLNTNHVARQKKNTDTTISIRPPELAKRVWSNEHSDCMWTGGRTTSQEKCRQMHLRKHVVFKTSQVVDIEFTKKVARSAAIQARTPSEKINRHATLQLLIKIVLTAAQFAWKPPHLAE
jgi:hypothetical protein